MSDREEENDFSVNSLLLNLDLFSEEYEDEEEKEPEQEGRDSSESTVSESPVQPEENGKLQEEHPEGDASLFEMNIDAEEVKSEIYKTKKAFGAYMHKQEKRIRENVLEQKKSSEKRTEIVHMGKDRINTRVQKEMDVAVSKVSSKQKKQTSLKESLYHVKRESVLLAERKRVQVRKKKSLPISSTGSLKMQFREEKKNGQKLSFSMEKRESHTSQMNMGSSDKNMSM